MLKCGGNNYSKYKPSVLSLKYRPGLRYKKMRMRKKRSTLCKYYTPVVYLEYGPSPYITSNGPIN
jgi:hypothetical protein